jgi:hypothetical protein
MLFGSRFQKEPLIPSLISNPILRLFFWISKTSSSCHFHKEFKVIYSTFITHTHIYKYV